MVLAMYEVFNPVNGRTLYTVPFAWLARLLAICLHDRHQGGLDYARRGEGWS